MEHSSWHQLLKEMLPEGYFKQINQFSGLKNNESGRG